MELFQNKTLRKVYENFVSSTIFTIFKCKYCNIECCKYHFRYDCSCVNCGIIKCRECHRFNNELDIIMQGASNKARLYIMNFVRDFFCASDITLKYFYGFKDKTNISIEDIHCITWDLKKNTVCKKGKLLNLYPKRCLSFIQLIKENTLTNYKKNY